MITKSSSVKVKPKNPSNGKSKTKAASSVLNKEIAALLSLASSASLLTFKARKSQARLFELVVLADLLNMYTANSNGGRITVKNATSGELKLAGAPCSANKSAYSYFVLEDARGTPHHEVWVSLQFTTLSWELNGMPQPPRSADRHEIDVGVFAPLPATAASIYPSYENLQAGVSCKHFSPSKEAVREALGLRRETALLSRLDNPSAVPWLMAERVPACPPSPLYLASSSPSVHAFTEPVDQLGLYMASTPFR
ncbi:hypothetical protein [Variovorax sp. V118]|uniref:hypothetical protein n=1 Tax=Variovorax sp. V118 TaxID=3065954 RepID=UPI0034E85ECF